MPQPSVPGRSFVTRRAVRDVVRAAVLGSYGVTGFADRDLLDRFLRPLGMGRRAIELRLEHGLAIDLSITVAHGLPVAEVARQVEAAVRYAIRHAFGREPARVVVHVNGLRVLPPSPPVRPGSAHGAGEDALQPPLELHRRGRMRGALRRRASAGDPRPMR